MCTLTIRLNKKETNLKKKQTKNKFQLRSVDRNKKREAFK